MLTKDMLLKVMYDYNGTTEEFMTNIQKQYHYIEVQVWDDESDNMMNNKQENAVKTFRFHFRKLVRVVEQLVLVVWLRLLSNQ